MSKLAPTALVAAVVMVFSALAFGQASYPNHPVKMIVPFAPGGASDFVARIISPKLGDLLGQTIVIDNRPGASGIVAFNEVRTTVPDGHTLFIGDTGTLAVNPLIHASLPYDCDRDLAPITKLFHATLAIQVGGTSRFRTLAELLAAARRTPGSVSYASLGNGHPMHVAVESMAHAADVQFLHVPFRDGGALMSAVANSDVDFTPLSMYTASGLAKAGKLRALAVASHKRLSNYPDVPTVAESGGPPIEMHPWAALVAVAHTPPTVIDALYRDVVAALRSADVRARVEGAGFDIDPLAPRELKALIAADRAQYAVLVREGRVQQV